METAKVVKAPEQLTTQQKSVSVCSTVRVRYKSGSVSRPYPLPQLHSALALPLLSFRCPNSYENNIMPTSNPKIILYISPGSPWGGKVATYMELRGIPFIECPQPIMWPRPDVELLGSRYRRIPLAAIWERHLLRFSPCHREDGRTKPGYTSWDFQARRSRIAEPSLGLGRAVCLHAYRVLSANRATSIPRGTR